MSNYFLFHDSSVSLIFDYLAFHVRVLYLRGLCGRVYVYAYVCINMIVCMPLFNFAIVSYM